MLPFMKTVGHRKMRPITFSASAEALAAGGRFNDELHKLPSGNTSFIPKGLYRFRSHAEANRHADRCVAEGMAQLALDRAQCKTIAAQRHSEDLKTLIRSLNEHRIDYLLIGGYALFVHGYHRTTTDIDLLLPTDAEMGRRVREALLVLPDEAAKEIDPAWFQQGDDIRVADAFVVDLMFNACGETYETLMPYAETVDLDGVPARTVNLEGLVRTEQTARDKDIADRTILEQALETIRQRRK